ncbi:MAG: hypothetical protein JJT96_05555 [Opitutales bacterium]|nr:hypothetical protein [Opitutales bacterium]
MEEDITTINVVPSAPFLEKEALDEYVAKYRREDVAGLEVSTLLDLFPARPMITEFQKGKRPLACLLPGWAISGMLGGWTRATEFPLIMRVGDHLHKG